jgi:hypothetical protein
MTANGKILSDITYCKIRGEMKQPKGTHRSSTCIYDEFPFSKKTIV